MKRYRDYDPFAWLYTNYWGREFHAGIMDVLDKLILSGLPKRARVLDLCCGDGRVSHRLARRGYQVTGVDGSLQMLAYAKQRSPRVKFLCRDARNFRLEPVFDGAISTFDSLNHILDPGDLDLVFANVYACLNDGASFVFDLNREEAYYELWARTVAFADRRAASITVGSYDGRERVACCAITLFRKDRGAWVRSDFQLTQRYYPPDMVLEKLERAGFVPGIFDACQDLAVDGGAGSGRNFFVARKPAGHSA